MALMVSVAGVILCYFWYRLFRSYKDINSGKFRVVHAMESKLPSAPYSAEWKALGQEERPDLYRPFTDAEKYIPRVFVGLYVLLAIWNVIQSA
jgi:hypothetical protein